MNGRGGPGGVGICPNSISQKQRTIPVMRMKFTTLESDRADRPLPTCRLSRSFDFADNGIVTTVNRTFLQDH
jgi:hypothetical protein